MVGLFGAQHNPRRPKKTPKDPKITPKLPKNEPKIIFQREARSAKRAQAREALEVWRICEPRSGSPMKERSRLRECDAHPEGIITMRLASRPIDVCMCVCVYVCIVYCVCVYVCMCVCVYVCM